MCSVQYSHSINVNVHSGIERKKQNNNNNQTDDRQ